MNGPEVTFVGNVTRDPELRFSSAGKPWVTFAIAVNKFTRGKDGERSEKTTFFNAKAFSEMAENIATSLSKGDRIMIAGTLETEEWTDKEGNKRSTTVIVVDEVGPSLRWATASVSKNARSGAGQPARASVPSGAPSNGADDVFGDENPFA